MSNIEAEYGESLEPYVAPAVILEIPLEVRAGTELGMPDLVDETLFPK